VGGLQCAQGKFGVTPDLTTFAKIIGGGLPVGAVGGPAEILESFTPAGYVFQSGTFSGHPMAMAAGLETLRYAAENDVYDHVNELGEKLRDGIADIVAERAPSYTVLGTDSMFKLVFTRGGSDGVDGGPKTGADVESAETDRWDRLFRPAMLDEGILLTANQLESQFVSDAHTDEDIEETLEAYKSFFE